MSAVAAVFFDGRSSRAHPVLISVGLISIGLVSAGQAVAAAGDALTIRVGDWERSDPLASVRVTPRVAGIHRTLVLRDGGQLQVEDNNAVDAWFPNRDRTAAWIDRLERHSVAVAASLLITVLSIAGVIFYGIPYAAEKIAAHIPDSVAREMGEQTVTLLDRFGFDKSDLPQKRRDELHAAFTNYVADLPDPKHYQLRFMKAKHPNAFALPGGIIVVTDEMVRLVAGTGDGKGDPAVTDDADGAVTIHFKTPNNKDAGKSEDEGEDGDDGDDVANARSEAEAKSQDEAKDEPKVENRAANERFLAVVAHEIGHEEHRHVLRSVLQNSAVVLFGAYFAGDVSSASALVVSVPTFLLNNHYSRDFEAEADEYAFASLAAHGISPGRFAEVMQAMQKADPHIRHEAGYLSTHPPTVDRIMKAREAAERFEGRDNGNR